MCSFLSIESILFSLSSSSMSSGTDSSVTLLMFSSAGMAFGELLESRVTSEVLKAAPSPSLRRSSSSAVSLGLMGDVGGDGRWTDRKAVAV